MISCYYFFSALLISRAQNLAKSCISLRGFIWNLALQSSRFIILLDFSILVNELLNKKRKNWIWIKKSEGLIDATYRLNYGYCNNGKGCPILRSRQRIFHCASSLSSEKKRETDDDWSSSPASGWSYLDSSTSHSKSASLDLAHSTKTRG